MDKLDSFVQHGMLWNVQSASQDYKTIKFILLIFNLNPFVIKYRFGWEYMTDKANLSCWPYILMYHVRRLQYVQLTAQQTIQFEFCTALISSALALISNFKCIAWRAVDRILLSVAAMWYRLTSLLDQRYFPGVYKLIKKTF
jgi:hypothetical protein